MRKLASWLARFAVAFGGLAVAACAVLDSRPATEIVKERAEARANAYVTGDMKAMYEFLSPAVRKTVRYEDYATTLNPGFWKAAVVDKVECAKPDVCDVSLTIEYVFKGMRIRTPLRETWIQEDGNWWYATKG
jgi:hypothetical protein